MNKILPFYIYHNIEHMIYICIYVINFIDTYLHQFTYLLTVQLFLSLVTFFLVNSIHIGRFFARNFSQIR